MTAPGYTNDSHGHEVHADPTRSETVSRLFREHNRTLLGFLYSRLKCESEAREIAQEAYVRILQLDNPGATSFLRAYLFRVAENLALDRLRQRRNRRRLDELREWDDFLPENAERAAIAAQEIALLEKALGELPPKCREAFRLHRLEELSISEVACRMRISERMVHKHICRSLVYVRLRREGVPAPDALTRLDISK
jgi:RNA polymerase sigma-70 factor (ECF subfamily)